MRGVSLAEISQATKIGARMLDAVETERFERLPGGVFNAAFVRQYARYLGLDEDRVVAEFNAASGSFIAKSSVERDASLAALRQMVASESSSDGNIPIPLIVAGLILLLGALGFGGWQMWRKAHPVVVKPVAVREAPPVVVPTPPPPAPEQTKPVVAGLDIDVESKDRCTIQISIDGRTFMDRCNAPRIAPQPESRPHRPTHGG